MSSDPQNYFVFFSWRNIRTRAYYKMAIFLHLEQFGANRIVNIQLTNSDWKPHLNLLKVFDVSLEMSGDPINYFGFTDSTNLPSLTAGHLDTANI